MDTHDIIKDIGCISTDKSLSWLFVSNELLYHILKDKKPGKGVTALYITIRDSHCVGYMTMSNHRDLSQMKRYKFFPYDVQIDFYRKKEETRLVDIRKFILSKDNQNGLSLADKRRQKKKLEGLV